MEPMDDGDVESIDLSIFQEVMADVGGEEDGVMMEETENNYGAMDDMLRQPELIEIEVDDAHSLGADEDYNHSTFEWDSEPYGIYNPRSIEEKDEKNRPLYHYRNCSGVTREATPGGRDAIALFNKYMPVFLAEREITGVDTPSEDLAKEMYKEYLELGHFVIRKKEENKLEWYRLPDNEAIQVMRYGMRQHYRTLIKNQQSLASPTSIQDV
jgi:hypothetical protein